MLRVLTLAFTLAVNVVLIAPGQPDSSAGDRIAPDTYQQSACDPRFQSC